MARPFSLTATNGQQIIPIPGGQSGSHTILLAFLVAPLAGTVTIEQQYVGSSVWSSIQGATAASISSGSITVRSDGEIGAMRVTFASLVDGSSPTLWLSSSPIAYPPLDMISGDRMKTEQGYRIEDRISLGLVPGARRIAIYGNNPDVDTATVAEDVWSGGGLYPWMTGATSLEVVSSSAADAAAGTGARTIVIQGLNTEYEEVSQVITLNGITPVAIPTQLFRINGAAVVTAGTGQVNAGDITIRNAGAGATRAVIPTGFGTLRQCVYTVPAGYQLVITSVLAVINRVDTSDRWATVASWVRSSTGVVVMPAEIGISTNPYRDVYEVPAVLPEKTDTTIRVQQVSGNNTDLTASILGYLRPVE